MGPTKVTCMSFHSTQTSGNSFRRLAAVPGLGIELQQWCTRTTWSCTVDMTVPVICQILMSLTLNLDPGPPWSSKERSPSLETHISQSSMRIVCTSLVEAVELLWTIYTSFNYHRIRQLQQRNGKLGMSQSSNHQRMISSTLFRAVFEKKVSHDPIPFSLFLFNVSSFFLSRFKISRRAVTATTDNKPRCRFCHVGVVHNEALFVFGYVPFVISCHSVLFYAGKTSTRSREESPHISKLLRKKKSILLHLFFVWPFAEDMTVLSGWMILSGLTLLCTILALKSHRRHSFRNCWHWSTTKRCPT